MAAEQGRDPTAQGADSKLVLTSGPAGGVSDFGFWFAVINSITDLPVLYIFLIHRLGLLA